MIYTRLRLRGLQPLWGTGVVSRITLIASPALCKPRTADSRPAPGPLRFTSHSFIPRLIASLAAFCAATVAANAEDFREPAKFALPAEDQEITFPAKSVIATIVLLNVAFTCAIPEGTFRTTFFFTRTLGFFGGAFCSCFDKGLLLIFSYWQQFFVCLFSFLHLFSSSDRALGGQFDGAFRGSSGSRSNA